MDYKRIEELLQKYWEAETTLEEEQEIFSFFQNTEEVPDHLKETAQVFQYFEMQKKPEAGEIDIEKSIGPAPINVEMPKKGKVIPWNFKRVLNIAAAIGGIVVASIIIRNQTMIEEPPDTFEDPKVAFEETKKAFEMLASKWNKGKEEAMKIKTINEVQEKVKEIE